MSQADCSHDVIQLKIKCLHIQKGELEIECKCGATCKIPLTILSTFWGPKSDHWKENLEAQAVQVASESLNLCDTEMDL